MALEPHAPLRYEEVNPVLVANVTSAVSSLFPIRSEDGAVEIRASNVRIETSKFSAHGLNAHQEARQTGKTLGAPVYADLELVKDGKVIQRAAKYNLGTLPLMGALGTFMVGGNDYYVPFAQLRLKPGAYTREKLNGEYETFIPVQGAKLSVYMDPAKGVLKLSHFTTNVSWYAIVRALGATDEEILRVWGNDERARELLIANQIKKPEADVKKLFLSIFEHNVNRDLVRAGILKRDAELASQDYAAQVAAIRNWMDGQKVDEFVTKKTLGTSISTLGKDLLLQASRRILDVSRGDAEPDDRDALEFKQAYSVEELIPERLRRQTKFLQRKTLTRLRSGDATLARALGKDFLHPVTDGYFLGSEGNEAGLASTAEAANPLAILSEQSKLTVTGEGGVSTERAIMPSSRLFRPSSVNFVDLVHTPEGGQVGVTTHAAINVRKRGTKLESPFLTVSNGTVDYKKLAYLTAEEASEKVIGYPEYWGSNGKPTADVVRANVNGNVELVPASTVEYVVPSGAAMFDSTSNSALFLAHTHPNRAMMAGKHLTQALPLVNRELPLTQFSFKGTGKDVLETLARSFVIRSRVDGTVTKVTPTSITVGDTVHELYDNYPMQAKVALNHVPVVKVGDKVKEGQLLADSNYSREGKMALGVNLRSAYMPAKNAQTFEDAIVISDSASKKLSSDHMHKEHLPLETGVEVNKQLTYAQFPTKFSSETMDHLDDKGVVKVGTRVKPGDPLIAAVRKVTFETLDRSSENLGRIHKVLQRPYKDVSVYWDEIFEGEVTRVVKTPEGIDVYVKTVEPAQVGDKVSMSSAAKGTISAVVPDDKMPQNKAGDHIEIIFNPHGVMGRINPSQTIEQAAGKYVKEGGGTYTFSNFDGVNHAEVLKKKLKEKGLSHEEELLDPETGKWLEKPVATGWNYVVKLDHPVRKKFSARTRETYTLDETPTQGKGRGGQSYDQLTTYSLLGHNAHALLGESVGIRGTRNEDFWRAYQAGETPPPPKVPFAFKKLETFLNAAGVDTAVHGDVMSFYPMTDKRVLERSNGAIERATLLKTRAGKKDILEETNGLFDAQKTGGLFGDKWTHVELAERIPHPLYEKVVRDVTGIKTADYYGLLAHTKYLNVKSGKFVDAAEADRQHDLTGSAAFEHLLAFKPEEKLEDVRKRLQTAVGSDRNKLNRASRYLRGLHETGMAPSDAYLTKYVPVVPPKFRGILEMSDGNLRVADSNLLYRDVILTNEQLSKGKQEGLPESHLAEARTALYKSVGALVGVNNALTHRDDREDAKGFIDIIRGKNNKEGFFQRVIARRRNDFTGRSTIEPDANLGVDEIGIPEEMAWRIYEPTIVRRLSLLGWRPADAAKEVKARSMTAKNALLAEMKERPVVYNRAPSLHRWNVASAIPTISAGKEIKISPLAVDPQNIDFDGDTVSITVPITEAAKHEAMHLLPSNNLFYDRNRSVAYGMKTDMVTGIFALTSPGAPSGLTFDTPEEAIAAYKNNKNSSLRMNSMVTIKGKPGQVAIGWLIFSQLVPSRYLAGISPPVTGAKLKQVLENIARNSPGDYNNITRQIMQAGFAAAATAGITSTIGELAIDRSKINRLLSAMEDHIAKGKTYEEKQKLALEARDKYLPEIHAEVRKHLADENQGYNTLLEAKSSGKANIDSATQMLASPILMTDINDSVVPAVLKSSYGGGMTPSDYVLTTPGARKGMVAKSLSTALPGFLSKEIAGNMGSVRIKEKDCGTQIGIRCEVSPDNPIRGHDEDLLDRHLLHDIPGISAKRNDVVTPGMLSKLRDKGIKEIEVRSPLTCKASTPPCQMCAGRDPSGKLWPIGSNIGLNYGSGIGERSTQLTLRVFHSGGTLGAGDALMSGFQRFRELLSAPETIRDQGALADVDGTIESVRLAPQGGRFVNIREPNGTLHEQHVMQGRTVRVRSGQTVRKGDELSDGSFRPQEIAAKKGMLPAQQYVVDQARKSFLAAGEVIRKPVLEVLTAGVMRNMEVTDSGRQKDLIIGDVIHENEYERRKATDGTLRAVPAILGISSAPLESKDLLERLNFQRLESGISEISAAAGKSDITGRNSPIPGIAYGAKFRQNPSFVEEE